MESDQLVFDRDKSEKYCKTLGGNEELGKCMVGDYPAPFEDIYFCAPIVTDAILRDKDTIVIHTSPENAKKLFPQIPRYDEDVISELRERYRKKLPVCPPWLEQCKPVGSEQDPLWKCKVAESFFWGHEGRHRIEAARREGLKTIPIIIRRLDERYCYKEPEKEKPKRRERVYVSPEFKKLIAEEKERLGI